MYGVMFLGYIMAKANAGKESFAAFLFYV